MEGGYDPIPSCNAIVLKVNHLTMEFTAPGAGDLSVLKKLRPDFEVGLGCVGTTPGKIDSADEIYSRVKKATAYLEPQRITLNPGLRLSHRLWPLKSALTRSTAQKLEKCKSRRRSGCETKWFA